VGRRVTAIDEINAPAAALTLPTLPDFFWTKRTWLNQIRLAAWRDRTAPDGVLAAVLARASAMCDHRIRIDTGIKRPAQPHTFAALVGPSGAGKTQSVALARHLLPDPADLARFTYQVGSGEGLVEAYMGTSEDNPEGQMKRTQVRHNALFVADEGQQFVKLLTERSGSIAGPVLRSMWAGQDAGQANATAERNRHIDAGSYSIGLVVGFQPSTVVPILSDHGTGMPQRFLYSAVVDPTIPDDRPGDAGPLPAMPMLGKPVTVTVDRLITAELDERALSVARGQVTVAPLDEHEPLMLAKVAALLTLMDGRGHVEASDWELARVLWHVSCAVRDVLVGWAAECEEAERDERNRNAADRAAISRRASDGAEAAVTRVSGVVLRALDRRGPLARRALKDAVDSRDRPHLVDALDQLVDQNRIVHAEGRYSLSPSPVRDV
jgi:hypothetical protein